MPGLTDKIDNSTLTAIRNSLSILRYDAARHTALPYLLAAAAKIANMAADALLIVNVVESLHIQAILIFSLPNQILNFMQSTHFYFRSHFVYPI